MEEKLVVDFFTEEKKHWWHMAKRNLIRQLIRGENLDILVAGIGGGMICGELKVAGHKVFGVEILQVSCEYANKKIKIPVVNGNLENRMPFRNKSFDIIIMADVLEHLDNDGGLLAEAFLCLKPKGRIIVAVPAFSHMWSPWDIRHGHKRRYSLTRIRDMMVEAGLSVKKASYFNMLLYPLAYIYRMSLRFPKTDRSKKSDFSIFSGEIACRLFSIYYGVERYLLKIFDLPFGLSIFAVGAKE